jgi:hypothetical protein
MQTVKEIINLETNELLGYLVDSVKSVPLDKGNKDYQEVLEWIEEGNTPEPFLTYEEKVNNLKLSKTNTINMSCKQAIESGFISAALGTEHKYESEEIDQLNLIGAVSSGISQSIKCSEDGGETWGYKIHTNTQLKTVLKDGAKIKAEYLQKASVLKEQIKNTTSLEELEQINW